MQQSEARFHERNTSDLFLKFLEKISGWLSFDSSAVKFELARNKQAFFIAILFLETYNKNFKNNCINENWKVD